MENITFLRFWQLSGVLFWLAFWVAASKTVSALFWTPRRMVLEVRAGSRVPNFFKIKRLSASKLFFGARVFVWRITIGFEPVLGRWGGWSSVSIAILHLTKGPGFLGVVLSSGFGVPPGVKVYEGFTIPSGVLFPVLDFLS